MADPRDLVLLNNARQALTEAGTIDDVRQFRDKVSAVKTYAQKARLGKHLVIDAAELCIRAERRLGQMLKETTLAHSVPGNQHTDSRAERPPDAVQLKDLGITKKESSRSQRIADVPSATFEQYLAGCTESGREPTFSGLLRLLRPDTESVSQHSPEQRSPPMVTGDTRLAITDQMYVTVLAVPPWPGCNSPGQPALSTDELCELPLARCCQSQAHLYLWTGSRFLIDACDVLDAWGFAYRTSFICVYEGAKPDAPWPQAHDLLLVGVRGDLRFRQNSNDSWLLCERPASGFVPDSILNLIEAASPGPYLLFFGRQDPIGEDWTPYKSVAEMANHD